MGRKGTVLDRISRKGLFEMTIEPKPEEEEEGGKTDANALGQQQDWCVQGTFLGFPEMEIFIHLKHFYTLEERPLPLSHLSLERDISDLLIKIIILVYFYQSGTQVRNRRIA